MALDGAAEAWQPRFYFFGVGWSRNTAPVLGVMSQIAQSWHSRWLTTYSLDRQAEQLRSVVAIDICPLPYRL